jgi:hypothetical protein
MSDNSMDDRPPCLVVELAEELVSQIEAQELPPDFEPGDLHYRQILAHIRHEYTNYEQLLWKFPICVDHWEQGGMCDLDTDTGEPCIRMQEAHDLLKWKAKDAAAATYAEWCEKQH